MKMSDVFRGDAVVASVVASRFGEDRHKICDNGSSFAGLNRKQMTYATHAINIHDELVEALESMLQSHGEDDCRFVRGCCQEHFDLTGDGNCYIGRAKKILERAKS